ncbi:hypothetical protein C8Q77DRAFT_1128057 [Trametes polyzona]|nr:hypothetical protein C8Q77DRAFT_1128057 [Trametes polyzona]
MEFIASCSSALLVLSMQQLSIQTHLNPCASAHTQHFRILRATTSRGFTPVVWQVRMISCSCWNVCSFFSCSFSLSSHTCERIAYSAGGRSNRVSSARSVLRNHIARG